MPKITGITAQQKLANRVNILVDGKYRFSLDIFQVSDLSLRVGKEYSEDELAVLEEESSFGKLYARTLDYTMLRPHSSKEVRDYLWKKTLTRTKIVKKDDSYEKRELKGASQDVADRVFERLVEKGYIDDQKFADFWVENRHQRKGISARRLEMELYGKGVSTEVVKQAMQKSSRDEKCDLIKVIEKKSKKYSDKKKLIAYLLQQGFSYEDIQDAMREQD